MVRVAQLIARTLRSPSDDEKQTIAAEVRALAEANPIYGELI